MELPLLLARQLAKRRMGRQWRCRRRRGDVLAGLDFLALLRSLLLCFVWRLQNQIFTSESLSQFDGASKELPIYLSILGSVFDVTSGRQHYGVGGSYHHFSGRDATRAFVSGNFTGDGLSDSVRGLSPIEVKRIGDWRSFYHNSYSYIGKLIGTYYDSNGKPTDELLRVEKRIKRGEELLKQQEAEEKKFPTCNSRWSQSEGGEVWCDSGYPRILSKPSPLPSQGSGESRCACFAEKQLNRPGLAVYPGCEARATVCKTS
ncbi:hypothetical protein SELMODRAFT_408090 [Selaginella moellendorffii]|uniref:Cytochrome b5 heme-binding domain-containing protein n=1 Tax=Selaginella moellendorffii TaxID=88036 RepID=D8R760_SELML|nr:hypothetical protein SELMODRAFT_408090 [Selaginella moellendorffii]